MSAPQLSAVVPMLGDEQTFEVVGVVVNVGAPDDLLAVREIAVLTGSGTVFLELGGHLFKSMGELVKAKQNNSIIVASNLKFSTSGIRRSVSDPHSIDVRDGVKNVMFYRAKHEPLTPERAKLKDEVESQMYDMSINNAADVEVKVTCTPSPPARASDRAGLNASSSSHKVRSAPPAVRGKKPRSVFIDLNVEIIDLD